MIAKSLKMFVRKKGKFSKEPACFVLPVRHVCPSPGLFKQNITIRFSVYALVTKHIFEAKCFGNRVILKSQNVIFEIEYSFRFFCFEK